MLVLFVGCLDTTTQWQLIECKLPIAFCLAISYDAFRADKGRLRGMEGGWGGGWREVGDEGWREVGVGEGDWGGGGDKRREREAEGVSRMS